MSVQEINSSNNTTRLQSSESKTLSEQVFNELKDAIISGDLEQGSKITEDGLAKKYGISRGPLREAIRRLEAIRLLVRIPHAGMRVVTFDNRDHGRNLYGA